MSESFVGVERAFGGNRDVLPGVHVLHKDLVVVVVDNRDRQPVGTELECDDVKRTFRKFKFPA